VSLGGNVSNPPFADVQNVCSPAWRASVRFRHSPQGLLSTLSGPFTRPGYAGHVTRPPDFFRQLPADARAMHRLEYAGPHHSDDFDSEWIEDIVGRTPSALDIRIYGYEGGRACVEWVSPRNLSRAHLDRPYLFWTPPHQALAPEDALSFIRVLLSDQIEVRTFEVFGQILAKSWRPGRVPGSPKPFLRKPYLFNAR
jgi:hypothetical protein